MNLRRTTIAALMIFAAAHVFALNADAQEGQATVWPTNGWQTSTPEEQGMSSEAIARLVDDVGMYKQDSLLVVRNGRIVADAYYAPYVAGIRHDLRSVTKSVVGTLIGILVQQGKVGLDRPVVDLYSDVTIANADERKRAITPQHLLDMASGIEWVERRYTPDEAIWRMHKSPNPMEFVLNEPMAQMPGAKFNYNGGNTYLLSALINRTTGQNALEFAKKELFAPLGITDVRWPWTDKQGITNGESGLFLAPHDVAKIGYLYLRNGMWDGRQVVSASWVERARKGQVDTDFGKYANLWWSLPARDTFMALGRHGQFIVVLPKLDVVAVMTGVVPDGEQRYPLRKLIDHLHNAARSDKPLEADREGEVLLKAALLAAATEKQTNVSPASELAGTVSGKTWRFDDNALFVRTVTLSFDEVEPRFGFTTYAARDGGPGAVYSEPLGVDGRSRGKRADYAVVANKAAWLDGHTFEIQRRFLGNGQLAFWTFHFDNDKLKLRFRNTDGFSTELSGERVN
ncbi:serine hydrolase [Bradyrhizobium sp. LHD-71]|uniref:serine hydrolase domain-containing protein n=1 Tax=Bradyrhizobium sp. LHD-71 TaxID=3072141 RepID=UPI00280F1261|nr:serine hydrolase [Bradyrhizobium sp. LHD-71]MDQ8729429.1 serine hydrolase [Bradyrhizobium sp. LHD-71]